MFHVRDRRTGSLFDPWAYLGPKRRKLLDRSWAGLFRKEILPHLPVEAILAAFHTRLGRPSKDAYTLMGALVFQAMHDTKVKAVASMKTYSLLSRVFSEQCDVVMEKGGETVAAKPPKEISSGSLQNPSDPDAGYSGHKGQGYQAQVMETYVPMAQAEEGAPANGDAVPLRLITHVEVEPANISDAHALLPAIEGATRFGLAPAEVLADSLYGSDKNVVAAAEVGVDVVSPVMGQTDESEVTMADFSFSHDGAQREAAYRGVRQRELSGMPEEEGVSDQTGERLVRVPLHGAGPAAGQTARRTEDGGVQGPVPAPIGRGVDDVGLRPADGGKAPEGPRDESRAVHGDAQGSRRQPLPGRGGVDDRDVPASQGKWCPRQRKKRLQRGKWRVGVPSCGLRVDSDRIYQPVHRVQHAKPPRG